MRSQLTVIISNPFPFPIRIMQLTVVVGDAPGPCVGRDLDVQPFRGPLQVPARGTATTRLGVVLSDSSPDLCQAVTWPLTYHGQAVQANASGGGGAAPLGAGRTGTSGQNPGQTSAEPSGTGLPLTGLTVSILITTAAVLLAGGAAILLAQRRRRSGVAPRTEDSRAP